MTTANATDKPTGTAAANASATSFAMRESGAFLVFSIVLLCAPAAVSLYLHRRVGLAVALALFVLVASLPFSSLVVLVRDARLRVKLGGLITVRNVALADVIAVERFRPSGYAGIGIRLLPQGTLYTVTLGDAIEIRLQDGSRFFVGSNTPDVMRERIQTAISVATCAPPA